MKTRLNGFFGLGILCCGALLTSCNKSSDPNAQLNKELTAIQSYIQQNSILYDQVLFTNTPVAMIHLGAGAIPSDSQLVSYKYRVSILGESTYVKIDSVHDQRVKDITEQAFAAVAAMPEGSDAQVFVPSQYAYGQQGEPSLGIPANTTLVYEIQLQKVTKTNAETTQFAIDEQRISNYLDSLKIQAVKLPTGVWYKITSAGTGSRPKLYDYVSFHYNGILLSNGSSFQTGDVTTNQVLNLIEGLREGLPQMTEGAAATFYIPSIYGYGTNKDAKGNILHSGIPSNACLIFEIKLNTINQ